jgi:hypothetical protein
MTTSLLADAFGALLAFTSPELCARTTAANANDTANARTFLGLIDLLVVRNLVSSSPTRSVDKVRAYPARTQYKIPSLTPIPPQA